MGRIVEYLVLALTVFSPSEGTNILCLMSVASYSHHIWNRVLMEALAAKGYNLTIVSADVEKVQKVNLTYIHLEETYQAVHEGDSAIDLFEMAQEGLVKSMLTFYDYGMASCGGSLRSKGLKQILSYPNDFKFDLVLYDFTFGPCILGLFHKFGQPPLVGVSAFNNPPYTDDLIGGHKYPAYIPYYTLNYGSDMTFLQRLENAFIYAADYFYRTFVYLPALDNQIRQIPAFNKIPYIGSLQEKTMLVMVNSHHSVDFPEPIPQNMVMVGGLQIMEPKPLPEHIKKFIDSGCKGAILFSLGTNNDILAQPKIKLFISHSGLLSTHEASWHGVPMVGIPFFADQYRNLEKSLQAGVAERLVIWTVSTDKIVATIRKVLEDDGYRVRMKARSALFRDQPERPLERALWWIDWCLRHSNAETIRSPTVRLGPWKSELYDVKLLVVLVALLVSSKENKAAADQNSNISQQLEEINAKLAKLDSLEKLNKDLLTKLLKLSQRVDAVTVESRKCPSNIWKPSPRFASWLASRNPRTLVFKQNKRTDAVLVKFWRVQDKQRFIGCVRALKRPVTPAELNIRSQNKFVLVQDHLTPEKVELHRQTWELCMLGLQRPWIYNGSTWTTHPETNKRFQQTGRKDPAHSTEIVSVAFGANILCLFGVASPSHHIWNRAIVDALAAKGHNLTIVSPDVEKNTVENIHYIELEETYPELYSGPHNVDLMEMANENVFKSVISFYRDFVITECQGILKSKGLALIKNYPDDYKFDLVLYDMTCGGCMHGLLHKFKYPPLVSVTPFNNPPYVTEVIGGHKFYAYTPFFSLGYGSDMTFFERVHNTLLYTVDFIYRNYYSNPVLDKMVREYFQYDDLPYVPDLDRLSRVLLVNAHYSIDFPEPAPPNLIPVGGLQIKEAKPVPDDLEKFINAGRKGAVLFSLGTNIRSDELGKERQILLIEAMRQLTDYNFLWKFESDLDLKLPKNVMIRKWMPQNDILAHPKVKGFITHAGLLSMHEASWHGVPMIGIPFIADQHRNIQKCIRMGVAERVVFQTLSMEQVRDTVRKVLETPSYRKNMDRISVLFRDQPEKPLARAVWWVEWALRHPDVESMQSPVLKLGFLRSNLVDVIAFLVLLPCVLIFVVRKLVCKGRRVDRSKKNN
ncbi:UDP-glucuronosyltransferase 2B20 [Culex quinquefasciatus]|uniref:UDP-glucuronosyltransferase 2B20 n=1 Tax=Culex quinquefasciatus TaxID=7176 RepID=B0VZA0_CULQU|nr:UDP-glucuronosyltransferase 2B20 [Culex quinquefasciatus]|eukprot:XP_001841707.1 UDP-glucuronosyltransferase 2B20 [Culex quinquefasciatus]